MNFDVPNLLCMWDESVVKLIKHLENGDTDKALMRAKEIHKTIDRLLNHCTPEYHNHVERKI